MKTIVNTHYHYDHTEGNVLYPEAQIFAHEDVPHLLLTRDNEFNSTRWWEKNRRGVPTERLDGGEHHITVGDQEVVLVIRAGRTPAATWYSTCPSTTSSRSGTSSSMVTTRRSLSPRAKGSAFLSLRRGRCSRWYLPPPSRSSER